MYLMLQRVTVILNISTVNVISQAIKFGRPIADSPSTRKQQKLNVNTSLTMQQELQFAM